MRGSLLSFNHRLLPRSCKLPVHHKRTLGKIDVRIQAAPHAAKARSADAASATDTLVSPAIPAADSQWPMFDLAEPIGQNPVSLGVRWKALLSAAISIGSPSLVPVP